MVFVLDNYDSFTYNLVQRLGEMDPAIDLRVFRNDKITVDEIAALPHPFIRNFFQGERAERARKMAAAHIHK